MSTQINVVNEEWLPSLDENTKGVIAAFYQDNVELLSLYPPNYLIGIFTHLKLCLADAIHNFKWVKIIQIWQNGG